jgi:hypothetical protein
MGCRKADGAPKGRWGAERQMGCQKADGALKGRWGAKKADGVPKRQMGHQKGISGAEDLVSLAWGKE